jgi:hypothetical protein
MKSLPEAGPKPQASYARGSARASRKQALLSVILGETLTTEPGSGQAASRSENAAAKIKGLRAVWR